MSGTVRGSCLIFTRPFLLSRVTRTVQSLIAYWLFLLALLFFFAVSSHILQLFGGIDKDFSPCQNNLLSYFSIIFVIIHSDYQISYWILLHLLERLGLSRLEGGQWSNACLEISSTPRTVSSWSVIRIKANIEGSSATVVKEVVTHCLQLLLPLAAACNLLTAQSHLRRLAFTWQPWLIL